MWEQHSHIEPEYMDEVYRIQSSKSAYDGMQGKKQGVVELNDGSILVRFKVDNGELIMVPQKWLKKVVFS